MTYRLNLELEPKSQKNLDDLVKATDAATRVEVIRRALAIYKALHEQEQDGWQLWAFKSNAKKQILLL